MNGSRQRTRWSVKRNLLLPLLMRLDEIRPAGHLFRFIYRMIARTVAWSLRQPDVRHIYLRRGLAKGEFMPFVSDIDLTVITDTASSKERVSAKLRTIRHLIPMLEAQSPVVTLAEFDGWMEQDRFTENRSFLYRVLEARETWETLYSRDNDNPLGKTRTLERNEVAAVIFSEILFWHRIVITEYSSYRLGGRRPPRFVQRRRLYWIFMKATTELYNFLHALQGQRDPLYTRRRVIEAAIEGSVDRRWMKLFEYNRRILDNRFDSRQSDDYFDEALRFLSYLYGEFHNLMSGMLDRRVDFLGWLKTCRRDTARISAPEYHAVDLDELPDVKLPDDENIAAIYVACQLRSNRAYKVLVIFVLTSLTKDSMKSIENGMRIIEGLLAFRDVKPSQIESDLVDHNGFRCFGIARQTGPTRLVVRRGDSPCFLPTLHERIFILARQPRADEQRTAASAVSG